MPFIYCWGQLVIMLTGKNETVLIELSSFSSPSNFEWRNVDPISIPVSEPTTIEVYIFIFYFYQTLVYYHILLYSSYSMDSVGLVLRMPLPLTI